MQYTSLWDATGWGDDFNLTPTFNKRAQKKWQKRGSMYQPTVGEDLDIVRQDHCVKTHPANNHNRRTLVVTKQNASWGFTIQSYGIHHKSRNSLEHLTYVDYVELSGAADLAGMRKGDIILSINGMSMEDVDHNSMVQYIQTCGDTMRMVVLFEDCSKKVELHLRYLKLKKLLAAKEFELNSLDEKIRRITEGNNTSVDSRRLSLASTSSTSTTSGSTSHDNRWSLKIDAPLSAPHVPLRISASTSHLRADRSGGDQQVNLPRSHSEPQNTVLETPKRPAPLVPRRLSTIRLTETENSDILVKNGPISSLLDRTDVGDYHSLPVRGQKVRPHSLCIPQQSLTLSPIKPQLASAQSHESLAMVSPPGGNVSNYLSPSAISPASPLSDDESRPSPATAFIRNIRTRRSMRSRSFRGSFRNSMSPALGQSYKESSNYVVTENNSRLESEPELLRLKQGSLEIRSPVLDGSKRSGALTRSVSTPCTHLCLPGDNKLKRSTENIHIEQVLDPKRIRHESDGCLIDNKKNKVLQTTLKSNYSHVQDLVNSKHSQTLSRYSYNHQQSDCDLTNSGADSDIPSLEPPTLCLDRNCNGFLPKESPRIEIHDANGNPTEDNSITETSEMFSAMTVSTKPKSILRTRSESRSRPWSTGSELSSRSVSWSSSLSDLNSPSSGSFEFYSDPFTPSPDDSKSPPLPTNQKVSETPIVTSLKKMSKRILNYSRHKEVIRQDLRLMNINEEEETTRL